jgi:glutamyl-tRNA reductase
VALAIIHHEGSRRRADLPAPVWQTCLREVAFLDDDDVAADADASDLFTEGDAYRELLEVLCGLRSPMTGETQVLGQFKTFLSGLGPEHAWLRPHGQRLLADAKLVRDRHLRHLGSRSYGSAVRRHVLDCRVAALVGAGALADELLPFLAGDGRSVHQWTRRSMREHCGSTAVPRLIAGAAATPAEPLAAALVLAAPVAAADVERIAARYTRLVRVVDLRAEPDGAAAPGGVPVVTLAQLFTRMDAERRAAAAQIDAARREIARVSQSYGRREQLRPFGWDDLCA